VQRPRSPIQRDDVAPPPPAIDYAKLLDLMAKDARFRGPAGPPGKDGRDGIDGAPGPPGAGLTDKQLTALVRRIAGAIRYEAELFTTDGTQRVPISQGD